MMFVSPSLIDHAFQQIPMHFNTHLTLRSGCAPTFRQVLGPCGKPRGAFSQPRFSQILGGNPQSTCPRVAEIVMGFLALKCHRIQSSEPGKWDSNQDPVRLFLLSRVFFHWSILRWEGVSWVYDNLLGNSKSLSVGNNWHDEQLILRICRILPEWADISDCFQDWLCS